MLADSRLPPLARYPVSFGLGSALSIRDKSILLSGGKHNLTECFVLSKGHWNFHSNMVHGRKFHAALNIGGSIYVFGGYRSGTDRDTFEYLPAGSTTWILGAVTLPKPGFSHGGAVLVNGGREVLLVGGMGCGERLLIFDVKTHSFKTRSSFKLQIERIGVGCANIPGADDEVLVVGGWSDVVVFHRSSEIVNVKNWSVRPGPPLASKRRNVGLGQVTYKGRELLAAFGGHNGRKWLTDVEFYDPAVGVWQPSGLSLRSPCQSGGLSFQHKDVSFDVLLD